MIAHRILAAPALGLCLVAISPEPPSVQAEARAARGNGAPCYYYIRTNVNLQAEWDYGDFLAIDGGPKVIVTHPFRAPCDEPRSRIRQEFEEAVKAEFPQDWSKIEIWSSGYGDGAWIEKFESRAALGRTRRKHIGAYRVDNWVVIPFDFIYYGDG